MSRTQIEHLEVRQQVIRGELDKVIEECNELQELRDRGKWLIRMILVAASMAGGILGSFMPWYLGKVFADTPAYMELVDQVKDLEEKVEDLSK